MTTQHEGFDGRNLRDIPNLIELEQYDIVEWVPGDGGQGKPEAVAIMFTLKAPGRPNLTISVRLKSRHAVDEMAGLLNRYADRVWPE